MIAKENYEEAHIRDLQDKSHRDPGLIERTLYAFGLLEALVQVGMPFIFKGGTSLLLLLDKPMRLSTDIDIIVEPGTDVEHYIEKAADIFPFSAQEEQIRRGKNDIEKRHFRFTYLSPILQKPFYILLDVLYENNNYARLVTKEISNNILLSKGDALKVQIPSIDCILGDKLTAFAPHTTGVPLNMNKDMEIMKQFYDICTLLSVFSDFDDVKSTYTKVIDTEIQYRGGNLSPEDALRDTISSAIAIGARGNLAPKDYPSYVRGARDVRTHIYTETYSPEIAAVRSPGVAYLAACILSDSNCERIDIFDNLLNEPLKHPDIKELKYLKKISPEGYAYAVKTDKILMDLYE